MEGASRTALNGSSSEKGGDEEGEGMRPYVHGDGDCEESGESN